MESAVSHAEHATQTTAVNRPLWFGSTILDGMAERHGKIVATLRTLADFRLLVLTPESGSYIRGFGQAYRLHGPRLEQMTPADPDPTSR
jgi:putative heme iron utilization protein